MALVVKNPPANAGDPWDGKILGMGRWDGTPLWYSSLENFMDRVAQWATVHGAAKSRI